MIIALRSRTWTIISFEVPCRIRQSVLPYSNLCPKDGMYDNRMIAFPDVVDSRHPNEFVQKFGSKLDQLNSDVISTTCQQLFHKMVSTHLQGPNLD